MHAKQRTIICLLVLVLLFPGLAFAGREGRLIGKVVDQDGKPITGVTVITTSEEILSFREIETTDKKGIFKVDFERLFVTYYIRFEKEGFKTLESKQEWKLQGTARQEFIMQPGESTVGGEILASTSNQAIHAYNAGVAAFNDKDYSTAVTNFEKALERDPELHQAWTGLSKVHVKEKRYQQAVDAAEKAIALGSTDESVLRSRWEACRNLGDEAKTMQALEDMEKAGLRSEEAKRVYNEGVALTKAGDQEGAFAKFQEAIKIDPNLQRALLAVATTGIKIDRNAEAAAAARTILKTEPRHEQALRIQYNACLKLGHEEQLLDALVGLAAIEPAVARKGLLKLAFDAYDANDMALAGKRFGKVLEVDPNHPQSHYYLGLVKMNEGANEEAKNLFERFLQLAPEAPEAIVAGELVKRLGDS